MSDTLNFTNLKFTILGGEYVTAACYDSLAAQCDKGYRSARQLAEAMSKDVADLSPNFGYFDNTWGVIGQIDNMYAGMRAQRDEGLAREAELRRSLAASRELSEAGLRLERSLRGQRDALQQLLAEATDLLKHMTCSYHRALENGYDRIIFLGGDCDSVERMEGDDPFYAKARAFLASPGCADGEKAECPAPEKCTEGDHS